MKRLRQQPQPWYHWCDVVAPMGPFGVLLLLLLLLLLPSFRQPLHGRQVQDVDMISHRTSQISTLGHDKPPNQRKGAVGSADGDVASADDSGVG